MNAAVASIVAAVILAVGGVLAALVQGLRKENRSDHATVQAQLKFIYRAVNGVGDKIDKHIMHHAEGLNNGQVIESDQSREHNTRP